MKVLMNFLMSVIAFVIIAALFSSGHFFWGVFLLLIIISYEIEKRIRQIYSEISWLKDCVKETPYFKEYCSDESSLWCWVISRIQDKTIKKGISKEDLQKVLDNFIEKHLKEFPACGKDYWSKEKNAYKRYFVEGRGVDEAIRLCGWGHSIPTPKLTLKFHRNILMWWKASYL